MNASFSLAKRNVLCYFRDRSSVVFSLMGVLVVIMLYLLFLRNTLLESYPGIPGMDNLMDSWVLSGVLGIVAVTTSAGSLQVMMDDKVSGKVDDLLVTPASSSQIAAGYIIGTFLVGLIMSAISFVISLAYLSVTGCPLSAYGVSISAALLIPSSLSGSVIMYSITSFLNSSGAFSGFFTVTSVLIGFLAGIYMPMGSMPSIMNTVGSLIPASHMAALFRQNLGSESLEEVLVNSPPGTMDGFRTDMGYDLFIGGLQLDPIVSIAYVSAVSIIFFAIAVLGLRRNGIR